jgi:hypothetical protein
MPESIPRNTLGFQFMPSYKTVKQTALSSDAINNVTSIEVKNEMEVVNKLISSNQFHKIVKSLVDLQNPQVLYRKLSKNHNLNIVDTDSWSLIKRAEINKYIEEIIKIFEDEKKEEA